MFHQRVVVKQQQHGGASPASVSMLVSTTLTPLVERLAYNSAPPPQKRAKLYTGASSSSGGGGVEHSSDTASVASAASSCGSSASCTSFATYPPAASGTIVSYDSWGNPPRRDEHQVQGDEPLSPVDVVASVCGGGSGGGCSGKEEDVEQEAPGDAAASGKEAGESQALPFRGALAFWDLFLGERLAHGWWDCVRNRAVLVDWMHATHEMLTPRNANFDWRAALHMAIGMLDLCRASMSSGRCAAAKNQALASEKLRALHPQVLAAVCVVVAAKAVDEDLLTAGAEEYVSYRKAARFLAPITGMAAGTRAYRFLSGVERDVLVAFDYRLDSILTPYAVSVHAFVSSSSAFNTKIGHEATAYLDALTLCDPLVSAELYARTPSIAAAAELSAFISAHVYSEAHDRAASFVFVRLQAVLTAAAAAPARGGGVL